MKKIEIFILFLLINLNLSGSNGVPLISLFKEGGYSELALNANIEEMHEFIITPFPSYLYLGCNFKFLLESYRINNKSKVYLTDDNLDYLSMFCFIGLPKTLSEKWFDKYYSFSFIIAGMNYWLQSTLVEDINVDSEYSSKLAFGEHSRFISGIEQNILSTINLNYYFQWEYIIINDSENLRYLPSKGYFFTNSPYETRKTYSFFELNLLKDIDLYSKIIGQNKERQIKINYIDTKKRFGFIFNSDLFFGYKHLKVQESKNIFFIHLNHFYFWEEIANPILIGSFDYFSDFKFEFNSTDKDIRKIAFLNYLGIFRLDFSYYKDNELLNISNKRHVFGIRVGTGYHVRRKKQSGKKMLKWFNANAILADATIGYNFVDTLELNYYFYDKTELKGRLYILF